MFYHEPSFFLACTTFCTGHVYHMRGRYKEAVVSFWNGLIYLESSPVELAKHLTERLASTDGMLKSLASADWGLRRTFYDSILKSGKEIEELKRRLRDLTGVGDEAEKRARLLLGCLGRRAVLLEALGRCGDADDLDLFVLLEWDARGLLRWFTTSLYSDQSLPLRALMSCGLSAEKLSRPVEQLERMRLALRKKNSRGPLRELVLMHLGQAYWRLGKLDKFLEVAGENVDEAADGPMIVRLGASDPEVAAVQMEMAYACEHIDVPDLPRAIELLKKAADSFVLVTFSSCGICSAVFLSFSLPGPRPRCRCSGKSGCGLNPVFVVFFFTSRLMTALSQIDSTLSDYSPDVPSPSAALPKRLAAELRHKLDV